MDVLSLLQTRGFVQQCTDLEKLRAAFEGGQVTYYVGFDPTADSLHVGHLVPVMAMGWLQRAGHRAIAVVGGGTALVGDPSGKTELRQMLTDEQIALNLQGIRAQLRGYLTIDDKLGIMVDNADWIRPLNYVAFLRDIGKHFSVNRMLAMEAYRLRLEKGLSFIEFNYQLLQAYDYLQLYRQYGCTLQMGGDDQWGNILAGTELVRRIEGADTHALTQPLIMTAAGQKMGKTAAGAVWLDPARVSAFDYWQYWYNVDDRDVGRLLRLFTFLDLEEIVELEKLKGAEISVAKRRLAGAATALAHGEKAAQEAEEAAKAMVGNQASRDLPTQSLTAEKLGDGLPVWIVVAEVGLASSRSEGRRLVEGGGVQIDGEKADMAAVLRPDRLGGDGVVVRVGKKRAVRVVLSTA